MATYDKLIGPDGQPRFGRFSQPIQVINHRDFRYTTPLDQDAGLFARHFHLKQFQFVGLVSDRYILGCAIVSLKYLSNAFVYLFDRQTGQVLEHSLLQPLSLHCAMSNQPDAGQHLFRKGNTRFTMQSYPGHKQVEIVAGTDIHIQFTVAEAPGFVPIGVCTRTGFSGWTYTQKANALSASGHIRWNHTQIEVTPQSFMGSYDWSCGYMRRHTAWNWASLSGRLTDGSNIGANFANGVNETGFTENGFWLNEQLVEVGPVHFEFNKADRMQSWRIADNDGLIDLHFTPAGKRCEKINTWLLASNFTQLAGSFNGTIATREGHKLQLSDIPGFCEDHYAKW